MFVKPGPNADGPDGQHIVRIPNTHECLPAGGRDVPENRFWHRRLLAGDVVLATPDAPEATDTGAAA